MTFTLLAKPLQTCWNMVCPFWLTLFQFSAPYICTFLYLSIWLIFFYLVSSIEQYLLFFESSGLIEASFHEKKKTEEKYNYTSIQFTINTNSGLKDKHIKSVILLFLFYLYRGYYMAARGYEFYPRVLKVSLTSDRSERVRDSFSRKNSYIKHNLFIIHFRNSKIVQLMWSPIAKCLSQKCYETRI